MMNGQLVLNLKEERNFTDLMSGELLFDLSKIQLIFCDFLVEFSNLVLVRRINDAVAAFFDEFVF